MIQGITQAIDSRDGVFVGGITSAFTSHTTHETMTISLTQESINQELSLDELRLANGGSAAVGLAVGVYLGAVATIGVISAIKNKKSSGSISTPGVYSPPDQEGNDDPNVNH